MEHHKELKLRFRFDKVVSKPVEAILESCEKLKNKVEPDYKIKISEHYIRFSIGMLKREKHSPNLKITLEKMEDGNTFIKGTYGPDPVLWAIFMFLHFVVASVFLIFMVIVYSKWILNQSFKFDLMIMFSMTIIWFLLYFIARLNRSKGISQMRELEKLYNKVIS
jgi:ABC-type multidrug transport system fused ATPase/permease subunit